MIGHDCLQAPENIFVTTVPLIGGLPPTPTSIRIISSLRRMFDFFDSCNKCRKPGFVRGNIYTSCISMVLLDNFANKSNTFQQSLSLPLSLSHFLPFPPWVPISSYPRYQDTATKGTLYFDIKLHFSLWKGRRKTQGKAYKKSTKVTSICILNLILNFFLLEFIFFIDICTIANGYSEDVDCW